MVIPPLLLHPDLALEEAYMDGALTVEGGQIYEFLELCFADLGWSAPPIALLFLLAMHRTGVIFLEFLRSATR